jgi:hypothetical protein
VEDLRVKAEASRCLQRFVRGLRAREELERLRREYEERLEAAVKVQGRVRTRAAVGALEELRERARGALVLERYVRRYEIFFRREPRQIFNFNFWRHNS